ncbi:MAG TPA: glycosyl transferase family 2, partial [Ktedonobacteraceae bacterium]|nr:glycosyl transferase family 2 [Ktedonobacteraceae bacterium]
MQNIKLILEYIYVGVLLLVTLQALFNIRILLYIWEEPQKAWLNSAPTVYREPRLSFTILLPAYHEEDVFAYTLQKVYDL